MLHVLAVFTSLDYEQSKTSISSQHGKTNKIDQPLKNKISRKQNKQRPSTGEVKCFFGTDLNHKLNLQATLPKIAHNDPCNQNSPASGSKTKKKTRKHTQARFPSMCSGFVFAARAYPESRFEQKIRFRRFLFCSVALSYGP